MKALAIKLVTAAQERVLSSLYRGALDASQPVRRLQNQLYSLCVKAQTVLRGADAFAGDVDPDLHEVFVNIYKDLNGFKPRWHVTIEEVREYLAQPCIADDNYYDHEELEWMPVEEVAARDESFAKVLKDGAGDPQPTAMALAFKQAGIV